jgi:hypothetical protein
MTEEQKHTKLPWELVNDRGLVFIKADRTDPSHPYDIEVMGDDTNEDLYPDEQKLADAAFIVKACNAYYENEAIKAELLAALESAVELVGEIVTGKVTQDDFNTGVLAAYRDIFDDAITRAKGGAV